MIRNRIVAWSGIILGVLAMGALTLWIVVGVVSVAGIETPKYEVVSEHKDYEIRRYASHIVAEVTMEGEYRSAMNGGFRKLADYIFGNNTSVTKKEGSEKIAMTAPVIEREAVSEKIAMTAPVIEQENASGSRIVAFVMPSEYTLETLPKPNNPDVRLVEIPSKDYAVVRFSGTANADKAKEMKNRLLESLKRDQLEVVGEPMLAQYNPPWTPPFMRRNEVMVELKRE